MNVIRGIDKPDLCENELPKLNYVFKQQVLSKEDQLSSINKILEGPDKDIYIFDEPTAFIKNFDHEYIATQISEFMLCNGL